MTQHKVYRAPLSILTLLIAVIMIISACSKSNIVTPTKNGISTQINVVNLSPDMGGLYLFINSLDGSSSQQQNALLKPYIYGVPSGYISVLYNSVSYQLRTRQNVVYYRRDSSLVQNNRYTVFLTGLVGDKTQSAIFTLDSDAAPTIGRGKVRFINMAARSVNVDVTANGTAAFTNRGIKTLTKYIELPAGIYDFKFYSAGTTDALTDLPNTTIQDGRFYTLYLQGVVGRTDTAALKPGVIINR